MQIFQSIFVYIQHIRKQNIYIPMKIRNLIYTGLCLISLFSCSTGTATYTVTGIVPDSTLNGETIYIYHYDSRKNIDSTIIQNNQFTFVGKADSARFCRIDAGREYANFILENGNITVDIVKHNDSKGTPLNEALSQVFATYDSLEKVIRKHQKELTDRYPDRQECQKHQKEYFLNEWKPAMISAMMAHYDANLDNDIAAVVLMEINYYLTIEQTEAALAKASPAIRNRRTLQDIAERIENMKQTAEGKPFVDFPGETLTGEKVSIADYVGKGKYTLIDFWASWCGPCREEMPNLAKTHEQYKDKGLDVISVAVWDKPESSQKAIEELQMNWTQIINAQTLPMKLYGFDGIPFIILLDPQGIIVARDLRGEELRAKIKACFETENTGTQK